MDDRADSERAAGDAGGPVVLWLGAGPPPAALAEILSALFDRPGIDLRRAGLEDVTRCLLEETRPRAVASALYWSGGDVLDAALRLQAAGWQGPYRALSPPLPDPGVIEREVRSLCPALDFAVISLGRDG
jgi:hypothetical protein